MVVPLLEEFESVKIFCTAKFIEAHETVYYYEISHANINQSVTGIVLGGPGISLATSMTEKAIEICQPKLIVLLGIAGGLNTDVSLGDVIVADEINHFLRDSKSVPDGDGYKYRFSGEHWKTPIDLVNYVKHYPNISHQYALWQDQATKYQELHLKNIPSGKREFVSDAPNLVVGHIASGDTVGAAQAYTQELHGIDRKFIALEMEAAGVASAAYNREHPVPVLVIRGISDLADERKSELDKTYAGAFRKYALHNAISLFINIINTENFQELKFIRKRTTKLRKAKNISLEKECEIFGPKQNHPSATIVCSLSSKEKFQRQLRNLFNAAGFKVDYLLETNTVGAALIDQGGLYFWTLDRELINLEWKHQEGIKLLEQRRNNFVVLLEECIIPDSLSIFYKADFTKRTDHTQRFNFLSSRAQAQLPNFATNDLFLRTILEELTMGKTEYSKRLQQVELETNIFAAMYFSAQVQEFELAYEHLRAMGKQLPRTTFLDREYTRDLRKTLNKISRLSQQIQDMVDLGLKVNPEYELGIDTRLRSKEIKHLIQDVIVPLVETYLGNPVIPPNLEFLLHDLGLTMSGLIDNLRAIAKALHMIEPKPWY